jgi:hypothetical protein
LVERQDFPHDLFPVWIGTGLGARQVQSVAFSFVRFQDSSSVLVDLLQILVQHRDKEWMAVGQQQVQEVPDVRVFLSKDNTFQIFDLFKIFGNPQSDGKLGVALVHELQRVFLAFAYYSQRVFFVGVDVVDESLVVGVVYLDFLHHLFETTTLDGGLFVPLPKLELQEVENRTFRRNNLLFLQVMGEVSFDERSVQVGNHQTVPQESTIALVAYLD